MSKSVSVQETHAVAPPFGRLSPVWIPPRRAALSLFARHQYTKTFERVPIFDTLRRYLGVQYVYAEPQQTGDGRQQRAKQHVVAQDMLAALPREMAAPLEKAIIRGDVELIAREIAMIRDVDAGVADALTALTRRFEYDTIVTMIRYIREDIP